MGGRGSKKFSTGSVLRQVKNQTNKGIKFPAQPPGRRVQPINQMDVGSEWQKRVAQDQPWAASLTAGERKGVSSYQGIGYHDMNAYLRAKDKGDPNAFIGPSGRTEMNALAKAMDKASLPEAVVTYRGIGAHIMSFEDAQKLVGTNLHDPAFGSTSLSRSLATGWASGGTVDKPRISYRITLPKGAKAATIGASTGQAGGEAEILVQRGAMYNVRGVQKAVVNGHHYIYIDMTYVGQKK